MMKKLKMRLNNTRMNNELSRFYTGFFYREFWNLLLELKGYLYYCIGKLMRKLILEKEGEHP